MKARIKETGEIINVKLYYITPKIKTYTDGLKYYGGDELDFNVEYDDPNYWTHLEHTYAGMAMQGILANIDLLMSLANKKAADYPAKYTVAEFAKDCAQALVEKMKNKEK